MKLKDYMIFTFKTYVDIYSSLVSYGFEPCEIIGMDDNQVCLLECNLLEEKYLIKICEIFMKRDYREKLIISDSKELINNNFILCTRNPKNHFIKNIKINAMDSIIDNCVSDVLIRFVLVGLIQFKFYGQQDINFDNFLSIFDQKENRDIEDFLKIYLGNNCVFNNITLNNIYVSFLYLSLDLFKKIYNNDIENTIIRIIKITPNSKYINGRIDYDSCVS